MKSKISFEEVIKVSDKESSITLSMYLGVKWEDSRIRNINQTVEDLQVSIMLITTIHRTIPIGSNFLPCKCGQLGSCPPPKTDSWAQLSEAQMPEPTPDVLHKTSFQGVGFSFLSLLWQPDVEIHHVRSIKEPKVMGTMVVMTFSSKM